MCLTLYYLQRGLLDHVVCSAFIDWMYLVILAYSVPSLKNEKKYCILFEVDESKYKFLKNPVIFSQESNWLSSDRFCV